MSLLLLLSPWLLPCLVLLLFPIFVASDWWLRRELSLVVKHSLVHRFRMLIGCRRRRLREDLGLGHGLTGLSGVEGCIVRTPGHGMGLVPFPLCILVIQDPYYLRCRFELVCIDDVPSL